MKYQHVWTKDLICEVIKVEKKGKQEVYVALIGDMVFRANKEIFKKEWKPIPGKVENVRHRKEAGQRPKPGI